MPLTVACTSCGAKLRAPDNAAGRTLKCPKCRKPVAVTAITTQPATPPLEKVEPLSSFHSQTAPAPDWLKESATPQDKLTSPIHAPPTPDAARVAEVAHEQHTKACPFCGETVLAVAKKCKHCGEIIDVTLRIAEEAKRTAERRETPAVYMNAGGGGGGASSASSSDAAASSAASSAAVQPDICPERVKITMPANWAFIGIGWAGGFILGTIAVVLLFHSHIWTGIILLLFAGSAFVGAMQRSFTCSFCEATDAITCFTSGHKCKKCGLFHAIKWE